MSRPRPKSVLPAALALAVAAVSVLSSGCFTTQVMDTVQGLPEIHAPALRVAQGYMDAQGRVAVLAYGGPWQADPKQTPHAPIWFILDPTLPAPAKGKPAAPSSVPAGGSANFAVEPPAVLYSFITLSQSIIKSGWPDPAVLAQQGFAPVPAFEAQFGARPNPPAGGTPANPAPGLRITYSDCYPSTAAFPDGLGRGPRFVVVGPPKFIGEAFAISDTTHHAQPAALALLPFAVAGDAVGTALTGAAAILIAPVIGTSALVDNSNSLSSPSSSTSAPPPKAVPAPPPANPTTSGNSSVAPPAAAPGNLTAPPASGNAP